MPFDPTQHITKIKGKDYLPVAQRIAWFRDAHPQGAIITDLVQIDPFPVVRASVNVEGVIIATAFGSAQPKQGSVYAGREIEKAETAAVGRALATAGFGTQFVDENEFNDKEIADTPQQRKPTQRQPAPPPANGNGTKGGGLTKEDARALEEYATTTKLLTRDEVLKALGVARYGEFAGTYDDAVTLIDEAF